MHFVITPDSDFLTESCLVRLLLIDKDLKKNTFCLLFVFSSGLEFNYIFTNTVFTHPISSYLGCDMVLMDALDISS